MNPFAIKPGETVVGLGLDFVNRLARDETVANVAVAAGPGVTVGSTFISGTLALAVVSIAANQTDTDIDLLFTATGTAGSVRKGTRTLMVRSASR